MLPIETLISIVIPVYNVEPYVAFCLESVVNQTYPNIEVLIVDDGSTDGSGKICDDFARSDTRFKVIHTLNHGLSAARNLGITLTRGEYVLFVDSDDWIEPIAVEVLMAAAIKSNADIVACRFVKEWLDGPSTPLPETTARGILSGTEAVEAIVCGGLISESAWGKLFSRELLASFRFAEGMVCEDVEGVWRIASQAQRVHCIDNVLFHYRMRMGSIMNSASRKMLTDYWKATSGRRRVLANRSAKLSKFTMDSCIRSAVFTWPRLYALPSCERENASDSIRDIERFARKHSVGAFKASGLPLRISLAFLCVGWSGPLSDTVSFALNQVRNLLHEGDRRPRYL